MADDKSKRGSSDRGRVASEEPYEVNYFARKHKITVAQARELIKRIGANRAKLNSEAAKLAKA